MTDLSRTWCWRARASGWLRRAVVFCTPVWLVLGAVSTVSAQQVSGVVHIAGVATPAPASGAAVVLVDSSGSVVRGMLTRDDGRFTLHAPGAGLYRVRVRQVGFSPDSSALLHLGSGESATVDLNVRQFVATLGSVDVVEKRRCAIAPAAGSIAFKLWQDVQSALTAAVITEASPGANVAVLRRFSREVDPTDGRVLRSTSWTTSGSSSTPYSALPADSLAARGFVVKQGQDAIYYAPDARTLISDAFARTHCFRPASDGSRPELVGLAFTPSGNSTLGQVSGVLWLDRASRDLRYLEFRYMSPGSGTDRSTDASGRIDYQRLPWGAWIVNRWLLRVPVVQVLQSRRIAGGGSLQVGATVMPTRIARLLSVWEIGGDATVMTDSATVLARLGETSTIRGTVFDSTETQQSRRPIAGLRVQLVPTGDVTRADGADSAASSRIRVTNATGGFSFDSLPAGDYALRIASAKFDTLAIVVPDRVVHLNRATMVTLTTVLPSIEAAMRALCGADLPPNEVALHGVVRDSASGRPIDGAKVDAYWFDRLKLARDFAQQQTAATTTGPDGRYVLCTSSPGRPVFVSVSSGARSTGTSRLEPSSGRIRMLDFVMRPR